MGAGLKAGAGRVIAAELRTMNKKIGSTDCSTIEAAKLLGMSVRSVQLMVDRGELDAWKTPGGHRRIERGSIERWRSAREMVPVVQAVPQPAQPRAAAERPALALAAPGSGPRPRILLIDDSIHFQKLATLLCRQHFPHAELHVADDGIAGLAMYGSLEPQVLIVDLMLPGIDGATLIMSLRSHPRFAGSHLVVVTSLDEDECRPYAFALQQIPVIHKADLVDELPALLTQWLPMDPPRAADDPAGSDRDAA